MNCLRCHTIITELQIHHITHITWLSCKCEQSLLARYSQSYYLYCAQDNVEYAINGNDDANTMLFLLNDGVNNLPLIVLPQFIPINDQDDIPILT